MPHGMSAVLKGTWQNRPLFPKPLRWYLWRSGPAKASLRTAVLHGEQGGGGSDEVLPGFLTNYTEKFKQEIGRSSHGTWILTHLRPASPQSGFLELSGFEP